MNVIENLPRSSKNAFVCPHCETYAHQDWYSIYFTPHQGNILRNYKVARCAHCEDWTIWKVYSADIENPEMIYPSTFKQSTPPHQDMPDDVKAVYQEARTVFVNSPKSAAALLRLSIQKLLSHLGEKGEDINKEIGNLVKKGLPPIIQKALDSVRVIGNNAVHPGQIDIDDNVDTANELFRLINFIVEKTISEPKLIEEIYETLPDSYKDGIARRDKNNSE